MSTVLAELIRKELLTRLQIVCVKEKCLIEKKSLQELLVETGCIKEEDLWKAARRVFSGPVIDLDQASFDPKLKKWISPEWARRYGALPIQKEQDSLVVAMSDPSDVMALDELCFMTGMEIKPALCSHGQIAEYTRKYYEAEHTVQAILKDTMEDAHIETIEGEHDLTSEEIADMAQSQADNSSFIRLVNKIIYDAAESRASDIHVEPQEKNVEIRYRIDGYLKSIIKIPRELHPRLAARIKILAKLDIAEQRKAQDGRIKILINGRKIDVRISVIPVFYGEKVVLRILDSRDTQFDMNRIGFERDDLETFKTFIRKPQGVVLVTGPTGSGKTTTLYSALQHIKCETKNIVTVEDPIEYLIEGVNQLQLNRVKDVTFTSGLRSILRQDPDVILVGEIRDGETAEIAFRASLTGHMVFSTLHTNNAAASVTRLLNIGLEPYLIASSVSLIVAQRLVRVVCQDCREEYAPDDILLNKFSSYLKKVSVRTFYRGRGCARCNSSGFYGRTSIFEMLKVDGKIKDLIFNKASEQVILKEAINSGMRTLAEAGLLKVAAGLTTLDEVAKVSDIHEPKNEMDAFEQIEKGRWPDMEFPSSFFKDQLPRL